MRNRSRGAGFFEWKREVNIERMIEKNEEFAMDYYEVDGYRKCLAFEYRDVYSEHEKNSLSHFYHDSASIMCEK